MENHHGEESVKFPNKVKGNWNAARPLEIVVSWKWILLLDTFNNEILAHQATPIPGSNKSYYHCLEHLKLLVGKKEEQTPQAVFHTDQGSVYSSRAFASPTNIITYFGQYRERGLQQIIQ